MPQTKNFRKLKWVEVNDVSRGLPHLLRLGTLEATLNRSQWPGNQTQITNTIDMGLYRNHHLSGQHCLFIIHSERFIPGNGTGPASVHCHSKIGFATVSINTMLTAHTHVSDAAGQARCTQIFSHTQCWCSVLQIRTWDLEKINISFFNFYFVYEHYICLPSTRQVVYRGWKKISDALELRIQKVGSCHISAGTQGVKLLL